MTPKHEYADYSPGPWDFAVSVTINRGQVVLSADQLETLGEVVDSLQKPPHLFPEPDSTSVTMIAGESLNFNIGKPTSPSGNEVTAIVKRNGASFVTYDTVDGLLTIPAGVTVNDSAGTYKINISLVDETEDLTTEYTFRIQIFAD